MKINKEGLEIVKHYESLSLVPYKCPGKKWTIGYGHTGIVAREKTKITEGEAEELLKQDLEVAEKDIKRLVKVKLNSNEFSALVSLVFNIGGTHFKESTLLRLLNSEDRLGASQEFVKWSKSGGEKLKGLIRRRYSEGALFLK